MPLATLLSSLLLFFIMKKHTFFSVLSAVLLSLVTGLTAYSQGPGSGGPLPTTPTSPTSVPIDGGASLLLAGGAAYGLRKLRQRRAQQ